MFSTLFRVCIKSPSWMLSNLGCAQGKECALLFKNFHLMMTLISSLKLFDHQNNYNFNRKTLQTVDCFTNIFVVGFPAHFSLQKILQNIRMFLDDVHFVC